MGAVLEFLEDAWEVVVAVVVVSLMSMFPLGALILATLCKDCEKFMSDQLGILFALIGIDDEDVITIQAQDQKLMSGNNDFYKTLMTQVALEHQATQLGIIDLLATKSQGMKGAVQKYSSYGKNKYDDGLPETTINTVSVNKDIVDWYVQADVGSAVTVVDIKVQVPKEEDWVNYKMTQLYGMGQTSMVFWYEEANWVMENFHYDYGVGQYKVVAHLQSVPATTITIAIGNYAPNIAYVVTYVNDGTTDEYKWVYFIGSGKPELDAARNYLTDLDMLPIVELRKNGISVTADKNSDKYKQTKEILGFIGIDVDTMVGGLESNSSIESVTAAYIYFGCEVGSNNPLQAKIVYSTLDYLFLDPAVVSNGTHQIMVTEGDYNTSVSWERQDRVVGYRTGVVVGTYEGGVGEETVDDGSYDENSTWVPDIKSKYYGWARRQETVDEYVEYRIWNVSAATIIKKAGLSDVAFTILAPGVLVVMPISQYFLSKFSPIEQGKLFPEILRFVTYAVDVQHLKYYQTEAFMDFIQVVIIVISIVLFILTLPEGGAGATAWLAWAGGVLVTAGVGYALKLLLVQIENPLLRAVVAVIATAALLYAGDVNTVTQTLPLITAELITTAVSNYSEAFMEDLDSQLIALAAEAALFNGLITARKQEYETAMAGSSSLLSTAEVSLLANLEPALVRRDQPDMSIYRAVQLQYDSFDLSKSMKTLVSLYNYDTMYRIG